MNEKKTIEQKIRFMMGKGDMVHLCQPIDNS